MQLSHTPNIILLNKQWTQVNLKLNSKSDRRNLWLIIRLSWDMAPHRENWLPNTKTYWIYFGLHRQTIYMYVYIYLLLLLSHPVMSNFLRLQDTRLPCPSPSPGIYPCFQVHCTEDAIQPSHPASLHVCVLRCLAMSVSSWPHGLSGRRLPGSPVHRHE